MKTCEKCLRSMDEIQFYTHKNGEKTKLCKKCLTMHINNFEEETFLWILELMDVPYLPEEWNTLRDKAFAKNPVLTEMSIIGKYLSKMKLKQWRDFSWADTEQLNAVNQQKARQHAENQKKHESILKEQLEAGAITEAEYKTMTSTQTLYAEMQAAGAQAGIEQAAAAAQNNSTLVSKNYVSQDLLAFEEEITDEDKIYLAVKWGRLYTIEELVQLERKYVEMMQSFDIQDADTIASLILVCKTDLKMNQYLDSGDIEGYQKLAKVSESLRKTSKFTAAQNKETKENFADCVGQLVAIAERDGFIPRFVTDIPQDKVDLTMKDNQNYLYKLVTQDLGFGQQIENAIKKIEIQRQMDEDEKKLEEGGYTLEDADLEEYYSEIEAQKELDGEKD